MERNTTLSKSLFFFLRYVWGSLLHFIFFWQTQPPSVPGPTSSSVNDSERGAPAAPSMVSSASLRNVRVGYDETVPLLSARPLDFVEKPKTKDAKVEPQHEEAQAAIEREIGQLTTKISAINEQMEVALRGRSPRAPATATLKFKLRGVLSQVSSLLHELDEIEEPTVAERSTLARLSAESAAQSRWVAAREHLSQQLAQQQRDIERRLEDSGDKDKGRDKGKDKKDKKERSSDDASESGVEEAEAAALWQQLQRKGGAAKQLSGRKRRVRDTGAMRGLFDDFENEEQGQGQGQGAVEIEHDAKKARNDGDAKADLLASLAALSGDAAKDSDEDQDEEKNKDEEGSGSEDSDERAERERKRKAAIASLTSFGDSGSDEDNEDKDKSEEDEEAALSLPSGLDTSSLLANLSAFGDAPSVEHPDEEEEDEDKPVIFATRDAKTATKDLLKSLDQFKGRGGKGGGSGGKEATGFDLLRALNAKVDEGEEEDAESAEKSDSWSEEAQGHGKGGEEEGAQLLVRGQGEAEDVNKAGMRRGKKGKNVKLTDSKQQPKYEMEDMHAIFVDESESLALFGVFDGHAGSACSRKIAAELPVRIKERWASVRDEAARGDEDALRSWWFKVYADTDATLREFEYEGATCTTALLWRAANARLVQCANVGDSTAFLVRDGEAVWLSEDHKPTAQSERARIAGMGIVLEEGQTRLNGLAVSRALGDHFPKEMNCGLVGEPYVSAVHTLDSKCTHLVVASDGLWDVLAPARMAELCTQHEGTAQELAQRLVKLAVDSHKCTDNVTVLVAQL